MTISSRISLGWMLAAVLFAHPAHADGPYVVLRDDGTIAPHPIATEADLDDITNTLLGLYDASGSPRPDVLSVWSTFPMGGNIYATYFYPRGSDVRGIGLQSVYGGDGTLANPDPPLRSILYHNDVLRIADRAAAHQAPVDGYAQYLFLLEFSHNWGPALAVPGTARNELIGFPFHWSFFMDAGGSPAGGNVWHDNGDGTFTTGMQSPSTVRYSMLDLYVLGLADRSEVPPFGVLENVTPPTGVTDPLQGGSIAPHTFPWFSATPVTVTATRRMLTIDDVVTQNGARDPAFPTSPTEWTLGIVLLVGSNDTDRAVANAQAAFDPIASSLAGAFHTATMNRGTLHVITPAVVADAGITDAGGQPDASAVDTGAMDSGSTMTTHSGCGCVVTPPRSGAHAMTLVLFAVAAWLRRRRDGMRDAAPRRS